MRRARASRRNTVLSRRYIHPPRAPCEPEVCVFSLHAVFFLALLMLTLFLFFSSFPSLFRFRFGHRMFHSVFFLRVLCCLLCCGFCCDSFIIWYIYFDVSWYLDTYVRWSHLLIFVLRFTICFGYYCVHYLLFLFVFLLSGSLPLQSYWSLSCDHGLHCSDEFMWEHV